MTSSTDRLVVLAIGAHPDDIEIGAGALVAKALAHGHDVHFLILTGVADRQTEARLAAGELGVPAEQVYFAGFTDGHLRADGHSVQRVRNLLAAGRIVPDVVVTHAQADSHNDHVEAHRIAHAVLRRTVFLHYSIHVSSEVDRFAPRVFVEVAGDRLARKASALARHRSQHARITKADLSKYETWLGGLARLDRAEGFDIGFQGYAEHVLAKTIAFGESPFHQFWLPVIGEGEITLRYESSHAPLHTSLGRDRLRQAFIDQWAPRYPLRERYANGPGAPTSTPTILTGNTTGNDVMRDILRADPGTKWTVEPEGLRDRTGSRRVGPEYAGGQLSRDVGVLSRVARSPVTGAPVVCAAGATGFATRTALEFLADPGTSPLAEVVVGDVEVAFAVDVASGEVDIVDVHPRSAR